MTKMPEWFKGIQGTIKPSILHGDLWSGNIGTVDGKAWPLVIPYSA